MFMSTTLQPSLIPPNLDELTRFGKARRRYQIFKELLLWAQSRRGSLPNKSGCHRIVRAKYPMNWTRFLEHFDKLVNEGLIVCDISGKVQTIYIPDSMWEPPSWVEL